MDYYKALQSRKPVTKIPDGMTRERAKEGVVAISEILRGPLSNAERIMNVHDRDDLRDILKLMDAQMPPSGEGADKLTTQGEDGCRH